MKLLTKAVLLAALALCLTGCNAAERPAESPADTTAAAETNAPTEAPTMDYTNFDIGSTLPVLSITTNNQSEAALDFVTEPVNPFVSESISSWTPGYVMPPAPYYEECTITLSDIGGTVLLDAAAADVKVRGNWTTSYQKKPLRIKFQEPQNLLGLNDGAEMKNWVLLAGYKDTSLLRDKTALSIARELFAELDLYAADASLVEVEINGQYWGVYLLTELQQVNADRVAVTEPLQNDEETDIGYFLEFDGYYTNEEPLRSFTIDYADNAPLIPFDGEDGGGRTMTALGKNVWGESKDVGFTIKSDIYSQAQHDFIANYVDLVYDILYAAAYEDTAYQFNEDCTEIALNDAITPQEAVEQVIDAQSLAAMYILSELTCDADIYWSSFFMSVDFGENGSRKLTFHAPWDFDSSMGNKDRCADGTGFYAANIVSDVNDVYETINPWLAVLMYEEWFQEIIRGQWTAAYDAGVFDRAYAMIEADTAQYEDAFDRNYLRWDNILHNEAASELSAGAARCRTQGEAADYLLGWLQTRVEFLNEYWHQ